jgi:hypothetical protein
MWVSLVSIAAYGSFILPSLRMIILPRETKKQPLGVTLGGREDSIYSQWQNNLRALSIPVIVGAGQSSSLLPSETTKELGNTRAMTRILNDIKIK